MGTIAPTCKSAISNSPQQTKQRANSTTAHTNDHTDHSVADTLSTYASNSVYHMPMETAPSSECTILLNSLLSFSHSTASKSCSINITSSDHILHSNGSLYSPCHLQVFASHL